MAENERGFYFVLEDGRVSGLITYADLNRRPARSAVHSFITELEGFLILAIEYHHGDAEDLVAQLGDYDRKQIRRYWRGAKHNNIDLLQPHYASLAQLAHLAEHSPRVAPRPAALGCQWREELEDVHEGLRNAAAHAGLPPVNGRCFRGGLAADKVRVVA